MTTAQFLEQLDTCIAKYDLLCHPFYKAWSAGELTRDNLREYAQDYYHHVEAFPSYLAALAIRLEEGETRRAVLANMADEKGGADAASHAELWLDFAEGTGSSRNLASHTPVAEVRNLIDQFERHRPRRIDRRSAGCLLCLRVAGTARGEGERARATRNVRRRRQDLRIFHATRNRRRLSLSGVA